MASLVNGPYNTDAENDNNGARVEGSTNDRLSIAFNARPSRTVLQSTATHHAIFNSSSSSSASSSSSTSSSAMRNNMMSAWVIGFLTTIGALRHEAYGTHYNTHHGTAAPHIGTPIMILAAIMSSTTPVDAVKCGCGACESGWFLQGWLCRVTYHMQNHPESHWVDQLTHADISLSLMGEPTPWTLVIDNVHGTTMYSTTGQCAHFPPGVYLAADILLARHLLPLCGTPCLSPLNSLLALPNASSSASGDISLNDIEDSLQVTQQQSAGSSQDVAAPHSSTLRVSPRLYLLMLLLLTFAHFSSSNHGARESQTGYFTLVTLLMLFSFASARRIYSLVATGRLVAKERLTATEFYEITGHWVGRKVTIKYQDGTRPLVCNCCSAWVSHKTLWKEHARTHSETSPHC